MGLNLKEIANDWFNSKKRIVKPSTLSVYHTTAFVNVVPYFSNKKINNKTVQEYILYKTNKGNSKRTIQDDIKILSYILKYAESIGLYRFEPFDVEFPTILDMRNRKSVAFSVADIKRLRSYLVQNSEEDIFNLAILMSLTLGLRIGEVTALTFSDFNFRTKMLHVSKTAQRIYIFSEGNEVAGKKLVVGTTKTKSSNRLLPVPKVILDIIELYMNEKRPEDYIFKGKYTKKPMDNRLLRERYYKVLDRLNIPRIPFHSLRHSFASNCIAAGVDVKTTSAMLGHSDVKMTLDIYTHPSFEQQKSAINKLGKLFS